MRRRGRSTLASGPMITIDDFRKVELRTAEVLAADPHEGGGRRVIFISGDDAEAKAEAVALFQDAGFAAIDLGDLATGGAMQQIHHPLAGINLIRL